MSGVAATERIRPKTSRTTTTRARGPRSGMVAGRTLVALLSAVVLLATGYYWRVTDSFSDDLTKANVVEDTGEKPADGAVDILMVGMDSRTDAQGNPLSKEQLAMLNGGKSEGEINTDTLIMIRIPNDGGKAVGVSIPRDSYVDIPGFGKHKVNSAYGRGKLAARADLQKQGVTDQKELERRSNEAGAKSLIATLTKLTGATIDHYAEVNLLGFYDITNAIGGVEVCLNKATKDTLSGANFPAGVQTLQGVQALQFVRQRHGLPNGDIDRITRQQVFMGAMAKKMVSGDVLAPGSQVLDALKAAIAKSVVLDKNWDIMRFAQQMITVTGGDVDFETIPHGTIDLDTPGDGKAVQVDPTDVKKFVTGLLTGGAAPPSTSGDQAPTTAPDKPTVTVLNGSGRTGLAAEVADTLQNQGFTTGETGNAASRAKTVVRYAKGEDDNGTSVVDALGGKVGAEPDTNLGKGKVTVILGKDFTTTGTSTGEPLAGAPLLDLGARTAVQAGPPCVN
ncbi:LCP family protein required for cell wall assembly [Actinokineospora baliensis]|uniref:LCP family protein n=1 Tax=Actinokineospora baliensis TaxID=547056 RepID=UPI00195C1743|nr:LCP family protein [Actinokineospora baliensis]MBM7772385.1 LCP family protein required for cell wall assembly [Actinokineospora baliensis]